MSKSWKITVTLTLIMLGIAVLWAAAQFLSWALAREIVKESLDIIVYMGALVLAVCILVFITWLLPKIPEEDWTSSVLILGFVGLISLIFLAGALGPALWHGWSLANFVVLKQFVQEMSSAEPYGLIYKAITQFYMALAGTALYAGYFVLVGYIYIKIVAPLRPASEESSSTSA